MQKSIKTIQKQMIYRNNILLLSELKSNQILSCGDDYRIHINNGSGSTWYDPSQYLSNAILNSFNQYLNMIEVINSQNIDYDDVLLPNLRKPLNGLVTLAETYRNNKMNYYLIEDLIRIYHYVLNQVNNLEKRFPDYFEHLNNLPADAENNWHNVNHYVHEPTTPVTYVKETAVNYLQIVSYSAYTLYQKVYNSYLVFKGDHRYVDMTPRTLLPLEMAPIDTYESYIDVELNKIKKSE